MKSKKHLSFTSLILGLSEYLCKLADSRRQFSVNYSLHDTILSGIACMYIQSPSLLAYQKDLLNKYNRCNLQTQFKIKDIPKETEMRDIIDSISGEKLAPVFKDYLTRLQRSNELKKYRFQHNKYLITLDGTQYFSSKAIHCDSCLTKENREIVTYNHQAVQAALVSPSIKQVIPLMPEEIRNTDGAKKQDCEINAAKRLIPKIRKQHPRLSVIYLADSIYATSPFIKDLVEHNEDYIFRVKEGDHKTLFNTMESLVLKKKETVDHTGRRFIYKWATGVKLNNSSDLKVNILQLFIVTPQKDGSKKSTRIGVWVTNLDVSSKNIEWLVKGGRSRWKIENECFNTLKNQGYQIEHNYGHGKNNLCFNFYIFTILAFLLHQILELTDQLYQKTRVTCRTLRAFWQYVRVFFDIKIFDSWESMLYEIEITKRGPP
jgi:hypothetical protein